MGTTRRARGGVAPFLQYRETDLRRRLAASHPGDADLLTLPDARRASQACLLVGPWTDRFLPLRPPWRRPAMTGLRRFATFDCLGRVFRFGSI